ncbi:flagellar filament capping protein FliD [Roseateles paludis]|jgi:flagellar hook-associated protein 2|uniref:Flagellar hook-associated protein 2 n=1 Tax=Roseateles paludis TaxID=3145238 RepID=A0ABV0G0N2_9BURK
MATISSAGIGSGLDVESLVAKLVAVERTPITQIAKRTDGLKTELSTYGKVQSALSSLRDAAAKLTRPDTWGGTQATSSDSSAVTATVGAGAAVGNVSVQVNQLATAQTLASTTYASSTSTLTAGTLTIQLGTHSTDVDGNPTFTAKAGSTAVNIDVADGDTLNTLRDRINAASAGVTASIVNDSTGARLVLRSTDTGESNGFVASGSGGVSNLSYDPVNGVAAMVQTLPAANARAILNGIDISSESNTLKSAIDGLNITLLKTTTFPPVISIGQDKDAIKKAIAEFTAAYNAVNALLRDQTKYDAGSKTAGALQGDSTAIGLQASLRSIAGGTTSLGGSINRLTQIGIEPGSDGNLTTSDTKLNTAMGDLDSLKKLFMGLDSGGNSSNDGFAQRIRSYVDGALSSNGRVAARQAGIQKQISSNDKRTASLEDHVAQTEARIRAQYNALDVQMSKLNGLSNYVTTQLAQLNKSG